MQGASSALTLIVEPNPAGHRLLYVKILAKAAVEERGAVVLLCRAETVSSPEWQVHIGDDLPGLRVVTATDFGLDSVADEASRLGVERVWIPDGDWSLPRLALRGWPAENVRIAVLVMRRAGQNQRHSLFRIAGSLAKRVLRTLSRARRGVTVLELVGSLEPRPRRFEVPDPIRWSSTKDDLDVVQESWSIDADRFWFGVLGAVDDRKNLPLILEALVGWDHGRIGLLIAGKMADHTRASVHEWVRSCGDAAPHAGSAMVEVRVVDRFLTDAELDAAVSVIDCAVLAHSNDGPSGILGKAVAAGTRVLCAGAPSLRKELRALPRGGAWVALRADALRSGMVAMMAQEAPGVLRPRDGSDFARKFVLTTR